MWITKCKHQYTTVVFFLFICNSVHNHLASIDFIRIYNKHPMMLFSSNVMYIKRTLVIILKKIEMDRFNVKRLVVHIAFIVFNVKFNYKINIQTDLCSYSSYSRLLVRHHWLVLGSAVLISIILTIVGLAFTQLPDFSDPRLVI